KQQVGTNSNGRSNERYDGQDFRFFPDENTCGKIHIPSVEPVGNQQQRHNLEPHPIFLSHQISIKQRYFYLNNLLHKKSHNKKTKSCYPVKISKYLPVNDRSIGIIRLPQKERQPRHPEHLYQQQHKYRYFIRGTVDTYNIVGHHAGIVESVDGGLWQIVAQEKTIECLIDDKAKPERNEGKTKTKRPPTYRQIRGNDQHRT